MTMLLTCWLLCAGRKPCVAFSSAPTSLPLDSSFQVFCTFPRGCSRLMTMEGQDPGQDPERHNATTLVLNVTRIQRNSTYSCRCASEPEPCGLDVFTGRESALLPRPASCLRSPPVSACLRSPPASA